MLTLPPHPAACDVIEAVQLKHRAISKSTVYRILRDMAKEGGLTQMNLPDGERYDAGVHPHYHFKCTVCGCILDVDIGYMHNLQAQIQSLHGHIATRHDLTFSGTCAGCHGSYVSG